MDAHAAGQGATEYLVLLAVVLIVALVSVALLGFFPGMSQDAQLTQSETYWRSAQPISIVEWAAKGSGNAPTGRAILYLRLRNTGAYPITITKVLAKNGTNYISQAWISGLNETNLSSFLSIAPGGEDYLGYWTGLPTTREIDFFPDGSCSDPYKLCGADNLCYPNVSYGTFVVRDFGFEYTEKIEGQSVTKRQVGAKPVMIRCSPPG